MVNFSAWSIHKPLPAILAFVMLMAGGFYAFNKLPILDFVDLEVPFITVTVSYSGATPSQMESEITRKVEDAVASITGIEHINSTVSQGSSVTNIEFTLEQDIQVALNDVRDAVSRVRSSLPSSINDPIVQRMTLSSTPVATYAIESASLQEAELSWLVDDSIAKLLRGVNGVGAVNRIGGVDREVRVDLLPDRLLAYATTAGQVSSQLRNTQSEQTGGQIYLANGQQSIRVLATVQSADELRAFPIALGDGRSVRLDEIARVEDRFNNRTSAAFLNGRAAVGFQIQRTREANELEVAQQVEVTLQEFIQTHSTLKLTQVSSIAPRTLQTFTSSMNMLYEGTILAVIVVFLFLRNWRATWISAAALPLSIVPTFFVMYLLDIKLHSISLLALSLVVGLLVDDAIVEVENIVRHLREGKSPKQAALDAAQEIGLAVIGTSLTLVAIFTPVAFMPGFTGRLFKEFAVVCVVSVVFSLIVARLLTPMMAAYQLKAQPEHDPKGRLFDTYIRAVHWTLANRGKTLLGAFSFLVLSIAVYLVLPSSFLGAEDHSELSITVTMPPGSSLQQTRTKVVEIEQILLAQKEVENVLAYVKVDTATLTVRLVPIKERKRKQAEVQAALTPQFANLSGARISAQGDGFGQNLNVVLVSDDPALLNETSARVENEIRTIAKIGGAVSNAALAKPEIAITPDFAKAAQLGITSQTLSDAIRIGTTGDIDTRLPKLSLPARQVPIRVQLDPAALTSIDSLRLLRVPSATGSVPLSSVAKIELSSGPAQITRIDRHRNVTITVPLSGMALSELSQQVFSLPSLKTLPEGVTFQSSGDLERQQQLSSGFQMAMIAGIFCVYAVLALLFNDLLQPFTILMALPLSIGGAVAALAISGYGLAVSSLIGILMLMGIAVKNSILLVDYAVINEQKGIDRNTALIDACVKRARPIVMTSIAMAAGMLPVALDLSGESSFRAPMAMAVLGGLCTSTVLSLLVVPATYTYISDFETWVRRKWHHSQK